MIAIDTNVLLRYLLQDNAEQALTAQRLITGNDRVLVTDVVLVETIWTLRGKKYVLDKQAFVGVLMALFEESNIRFENGQTVWKALNDYREAKPVQGKDVDFADALIVAKAKWLAGAEGDAFDGVYTFDKAAQRLPGAKTL